MRGHYDHCKSVSENIKIKPALLSRFDVTFILLDKPDEVHKITLRSAIKVLIIIYCYIIGI